MSAEDDPATRPTVPDGAKPYTVYVSWHHGKPELVGETTDSSGYARQRPVFELPLSPERAKQLCDALNDYAKRCIDVKKALLAHDDGVSYREAREKKNTAYNEVLRVVDNVLAHIGVHAHE